jgi:hypothetical protein
MPVVRARGRQAQEIAMLLLDNRSRTRRVRLVMLGSVLWCLAMSGWAADLSTSYGLAPGDGGQLRPLAQRLQAAVLVGLAGLLPMLAMAVYMRCYLIRLDRRGDRLQAVAIGLFAPVRRELAVAQVRRVRAHDGRFHAGGVAVDAPWISVYVAGRWLPYLVDLQADRVDAAAIARLVRGGEPVPARPAPDRTKRPQRPRPVASRRDHRTGRNRRP